MGDKLNWSELFQGKLYDSGYSADDVYKIYYLEMEGRAFFEFGDIMPEWIQLQNIERGNKEMRFIWASRSTGATCPKCNHESTSKHGDKDFRTIQDIPRDGKSVFHNVEVNKYNCNNPNCEAKVFVEHIPTLIGDKYARKTIRFTEYCIARAAASSCNRAEGDIKREGGVVSNDSIARYLKAEASKIVKANLESDSVRALEVRVLSVDDFNLRKGDKSSGCTVFVDGDTHRVLILAKGTTKEAAMKVMEKFRSVEILSRDRATSYAAAGKELGLTQVADRFHLIQNVQKAVNDALAAEFPARVFIRSGDGWISTESDTDGAAAPGNARYRVAAEDVEERVRLAGLTPTKAKKYRDTLQMLELDSAGLRTAQIAESMGVSQPYVRLLRRNAVITLQEVNERIAKRAEVIKSIPAPNMEPPGKKAVKTVGGERVKPSGESIVAPYREAVITMWKAGGNHRTIHKTLVDMGFNGSMNAIYQYILKLKKESPEIMVREKPEKSPAWAGDFELDKAESLPDASLDSCTRDDVYAEILRQARETRPKNQCVDNTSSTGPETEKKPEAGEKKQNGSRPASTKTSPLPPDILDLMYGPEDAASNNEPEPGKKNNKTRVLTTIQSQYMIISALVLFLTEFYFIIDNNNIDALNSFIEKYKTSSIDALSQFANGLEMDYEAVKNSLIYKDISNGPTEARNSLTKSYHRRSRGRAGLELLQAYILIDQKIAA